MTNKTYHGTVVKQLVAEGSKSQHDAVLLVTSDDEQFKLRRLGANPFQDEQLEELVGMEMRFTGTKRGSTLFVDEWEEAEDSAGVSSIRKKMAARKKRFQKKRTAKKSTSTKKVRAKKSIAKKKTARKKTTAKNSAKSRSAKAKATRKKVKRSK